MRALSLSQPWAWLIVTPDSERPQFPLKDIENRTWRLPTKSFSIPQRIYVHATLKMADLSYQIIRDILEPKSIQIPAKEDLALGAIIGEVTIKSCVVESDSAWFQGPFGFELQHPKVYDVPIQCKGQLYFWQPPEDLMEPSYSILDFDVCECGDYRQDHDPVTGRCKMPDNMSHGMEPCLGFRLHEKAVEVPEPFRSL